MWWPTFAACCNDSAGGRRRRHRGRILAAALLLACSLLAAAAVPAREPVDPELRARLKEAVARSESFENRFAAQVWLMDMSQRLEPHIRDHGERLELLRQVHAEARRADLSPELVLAVIQVESNFNRFAISSAGARGLMQIMPFWLEEIGRPDANLFRVRTNLRFGTTILRYYLDRENGDLTRALARYNGSTGQVWYPNRVYRALNQRWYRQ
ncbi:lytic transglycosylase domain-containing protein [Aquisalimonas lutea]|uniref:lytic transglycosylase domain-containing protein n=1 Tax=Aquisalimonas lutea TaxID=1327750 RepID=UPI003390146C